jgi:hypothetical protein
LNNADVATPYPGKAVTSTGAEPSALKSKTQTVVAPGRGAGVEGASSLVIVPTAAPAVPIV